MRVPGLPRLWNRSDVELSDYWEHCGWVYKTVGIITDPVIVVENLLDGKIEHHVIASRNFAEFKRLRPEDRSR